MSAEKGTKNQTTLTTSRVLFNESSFRSAIHPKNGGQHVVRVDYFWQSTTLNVFQIKLSTSRLSSQTLSPYSVIRAHQTLIGKKEQCSYVSQGKLPLLNQVDLAARCARHTLKLVWKRVKGKEACSYFMNNNVCSWILGNQAKFQAATTGVLVLGGMKLIFLITVSMVKYFGFVIKNYW